jgi:hypothetical protein
MSAVFAGLAGIDALAVRFTNNSVLDNMGEIFTLTAVATGMGYLAIQAAILMRHR